MRGLKFWFHVTVVILSLLSVDCAFAQAKLSFDREVYDFGDFLITDGPVSCYFEYTNIGDKPAVIHNIVSSCGCTEPEWSSAPIKPGQKGRINVTFLNDQGPYPFNKVLTVYTSASSKPILLRIRGVVHKKKKPLAELYPSRLGNLGFKMLKVEFGQVVEGRVKSETFSVANMGSSPVRIGFSNDLKGIRLKPSAETIRPGETVSVTVEFDTRAYAGFFGRKNVPVKVYQNGSYVSDRLYVSFLLKPDFSNVSAIEKISAPMPVFDNSSAMFDAVAKGKKVAETFHFVNTGKKPLKIYAADTNMEGIDVDYPAEVEPGEDGLITVQAATGNLKAGENMLIVTLVTNSPSRSLVNLFITITIK